MAQPMSPLPRFVPFSGVQTEHAMWLLNNLSELPVTFRIKSKLLSQAPLGLCMTWWVLSTPVSPPTSFPFILAPLAFFLFLERVRLSYLPTCSSPGQSTVGTSL